MKIAILGAKVIGGTLAKKWARTGHEIKIGVRNTVNPEVQRLASELGPNVSVSTPAEAIAFGKVVVFAIPGAAMGEAITQHAFALSGKIIIDTANKMGAAVMNSLATFSENVPTAQVFRAFNNLGWENFEQPYFGDLQADLFYCGPAGDAQTRVERLISDVGLRPIYVGGLEQIRLVDALTSLWTALALGQGRGRHLAFKLLTD